MHTNIKVIYVKLEAVETVLFLKNEHILNIISSYSIVILLITSILPQSAEEN